MALMHTTWSRRDRSGEPLPDELEGVPMLLAISDNGTEMRAGDTRRFMALCSIAQHFGRPSTPTDQAWIETLWGHVKYEFKAPQGLRAPPAT